MHQSSSRWRKPKKRGSKAGRLAAAHAARLKASSSNTSRPSTRPNAGKEKEPPQPSTSKEATPQASTSRTVTPSTSTEAAPQSTSKTASLTKIEMFGELLPLSTQSRSAESAKSEYILIQRVKLEKLLASSVKCKVCAGSAGEVNIVDRQGFAEKVIVKCQLCEEMIAQEWTSERISMKSSARPPFKVNREMTSAFLSAGLGHAGMETFSASLGMNCMSHDSFSTHLKSLEKDILAFKESVLSEARKLTREIYELEDEALRTEEIIDVFVSYDGTWQKRGFTSLYGIGFVIDLKSVLVIDYEILSKHCYSCVIAEKSLGVESDEYKEWSEQHIASGTCNMNYQGSSPNMETEAAVRMWQRSVRETKFRYTTVLSDGDAKTFNKLCELQPYGPEHELKKEECINHVSKRLYRGLKQVVADCRVKKITLGGTGAGQLTERVMVKLCNYYRLAIENNLGNVEDMRKAILATIYHYASTDKKPNHKFCPTGSESWCFFNKARALKQKPDSHSKMSTSLNGTVFKYILPVYERLSNNELLSRCLTGGTQNKNECLHSVVWHKVPKEIFVSKARLEIGVVHALAEFNMGKVASKHFEYQLRNESMPQATLQIAKKLDMDRIKKSQEGASRFKRKQNRKEKAEREAKHARREGTTYQPGGF